MSEKQKSFVKSAAILGIAGLIVKVLGAVFRIPLVNAVGTEGMGYYNVAYPIYALLVVVSTAGLPTAISKLVSERAAIGDYAGAHATFRAAFRVLVLAGVITSLVMFAASGFIAGSIVMQPKGALALMAISPALFFVAVLSAYRGYFQGLQLMSPTAVTQVIEQVGKLIFGLYLAYLWMPNGPEYGAGGALAGVSISEVCALVYIMGMYRRRRKELLLRAQAGRTDKKKNMGGTVKKLLLIAVPVTLGACVMPIMAAIDSVIISRSLQAIGYSQQASASMYGTLTGVVNPLINMPAVLSLALAMSLVPSISASAAQKNALQLQSKVSFGLKLAVCIGLPASFGFYLLAGPIIHLLFRSVAGAEFDLAVSLLRVLSLGVLFLTLVQSMTGVLQGLGKPALPVVGLAAGAAVKVFLSISLIRDANVNIMGAVYGTMACYAIAAAIDIAFVLKNIRLRLSLMDHIIKPAVATALMGGAALLVYRALAGWSGTVGVLAAILAALLLYGFSLMFMQAVTKEETALMPGGGRMRRLMRTAGIWKE
jgi:stage V sporulation protein B